MKIWNTLHRQLEEFRPREPGRVGVYTCGPTVYNPLTLGNLRSYLFADVLKRTLRFFGYEVTHVMNVTDVGHLVSDADEGEDKLEREAVRRGKNAWELARMYEELAIQDMDRLNWLRPDVMPRATDHIADQIALIRRLEEKGFTYPTSDGIYFDTSKFDRYGRLSGQPLEEKEEGARVAVNPEKKYPTDFALWKLSEPMMGRLGPPNEVWGAQAASQTQVGTEGSDAARSSRRRAMEWESPWGVGFPGWHIECSAMSVKYLGQPFDIHTGGVDLIPVHHENEIAQTEAATGDSLARYWLHNEHLLVDGRRMGKSEGNAYTLEDLIAKGFDPLAFRYYCLGTHYRQKLNFTWEGLEAAQSALKNLYAYAQQIPNPQSQIPNPKILERVTAALENDLNTPEALALMWEMLKSDTSLEEKGAILLEMDRVLGLRLDQYIGHPMEVPAEVQKLAEEREQAREGKDWKRADSLREQIQSLGWQVEDREDGEYRLAPLT